MRTGDARRTFYAMLAVAIAVTLGACGGSGNPAASTAAKAPAKRFTAYDETIRSRVEREIDGQLRPTIRKVESRGGTIDTHHTGCEPQDARAFSCTSTIDFTLTVGSSTCTGSIKGRFAGTVDPVTGTDEWHNISSDSPPPDCY